MDSFLWPEEQEVNLLRAIEECGYGNWFAVGTRLNRDPEKCKRYYLNNFILNPSRPELCEIVQKCLKRNTTLCNSNYCIKLDPIHRDSVASIIEIENKINELDESNSSYVLKRKDCYENNSLVTSDFNSKRGDFAIEYNDNAESMLTVLRGADEFDIKNEDQRIFEEAIQLAVVQAYNGRLLERESKKRIIKEHALLDKRKTLSMLQRLEKVQGKIKVMRFLNLIQFFNGPQLDFYIEKVSYEHELRNKMYRLISYRKLGIKFLESINLYEILNKKRTAEMVELNSLMIQFDWRTLKNKLSYLNDKNTSTSAKLKKKSKPLELHNLPGFSKLTKDEKELCSISRIVPESFLGFKKLLVDECIRTNGLRLANARSLIKIDVNKTRKIYDFLMKKEMIWVQK